MSELRELDNARLQIVADHYNVSVDDALKMAISLAHFAVQEEVAGKTLMVVDEHTDISRKVVWA